MEEWAATADPQVGRCAALPNTSGHKSLGLCKISLLIRGISGSNFPQGSVLHLHGRVLQARMLRFLPMELQGSSIGELTSMSLFMSLMNSPLVLSQRGWVQR